MTRSIFTVTFGLLLCGASIAPVAAHEVWLDPMSYQVKPGETIKAGLLNGQKFDGSSFSYNPDEFVRFERHSGGKIVPVTGRLGDEPALMISGGLPAGLHVFAFQSVPSTLKYETWEKFQRFFTDKALGDIGVRHDARGLPRKDFTEVYTRYAKTLVGVGEAAGADKAVGLETEIVALANPYTGLKGVMPVRVLYREMPRINAQVELFEKAPDGTVAVTFHRTNKFGEARLPVKPGYKYLVDAVVFREPSKSVAAKTGAVWESLWASLTFAVPG